MARFYAADLGDYNEGILRGEWVEVSSDPDEMQASIDAMLAGRPGAEEWAMHDCEGLPKDFSVCEYPDLELIAKYAALCNDHEEGAVNAAIDNFGIAYVDEDTMETYIGLYPSMEDVARGFLENTGSLECIPEILRSYFDFKAYGRDLVLGGDVWRSEDGHTFWNR